ncbi:hypothetical protein HMPREF0462_1557 [Helicobacter pylori 83]|uniref:Uncharacterized protein n=1 Tax=Helicobacter pylori 83 TaxID=585538 RepID=F4D4L1_HELPX|nr:hypothetical protein HMPREF0462_1557 [Helicobacter pylori 83]EJB21338.1 hypothetical protein HPCPY6261_0181 [Helicobacter pylori CPY6261]GHQ03081.1 hypothetical protein JP0056_05560 [Helicobacter pylori]GHS03946.1 hypothetical protein JP0113_05880 [Helicobacter pylori]
MPYRLEKDFQDLIASNSNIQKDIRSVLEMDYKDFKLLREDTYINGITADFTLFEKNKVRAIIECKGGAIGGASMCAVSVKFFNTNIFLKTI